MSTYKGLDFLRYKLNFKKNRVRTRYLYYEMKNLTQDYSESIPPAMTWLRASLGWCAKAAGVPNVR